MADLRRISYFLSVVDHGTLTAAANDLRIAQPALSRHMKALETETGLRLFQRVGNRLVLTPSGMALVPIARRLFSETRNFDRAAERLRTGSVERLVCGATESTIRGFIAPFLAGLDGDAPTITTVSGRHHELPQLLHHGIDFLIVPFAPASGPRARHLGTLTMRANISPHHRWIADGRTSVSMRELADEQLILPPPRTTSREVIEQVMLARYPPRLAPIECDDHLTILALAAAGRGVAVSPEPEQFGTRQLQITSASDGAPPLAFPLYASWLPGHYAETEIRRVGARLQQHLGSSDALANL